MTLQKIFDKVAEHLVYKQQATAKASNNQCMYRTPDGKSCAVGCLIPSEIYHLYDQTPTREEVQNNKLEGWGVSHREVQEALAKAGVWNGETHAERGAKYLLLKDLQYVHDNRIVPRWSEELRKVAKKHKLSDSILE